MKSAIPLWIAFIFLTIVHAGVRNSPNVFQRKSDSDHGAELSTKVERSKIVSRLIEPTKRPSRGVDPSYHIPDAADPGQHPIEPFQNYPFFTLSESVHPDLDQYGPKQSDPLFLPQEGENQSSLTHPISFHSQPPVQPSRSLLPPSVQAVSDDVPPENVVQPPPSVQYLPPSQPVSPLQSSSAQQHFPVPVEITYPFSDTSGIPAAHPSPSRKYLPSLPSSSKPSQTSQGFSPLHPDASAIRASPPNDYHSFGQQPPLPSPYSSSSSSGHYYPQQPSQFVGANEKLHPESLTKTTSTGSNIGYHSNHDGSTAVNVQTSSVQTTIRPTSDQRYPVPPDFKSTVPVSGSTIPCVGYFFNRQGQLTCAQWNIRIERQRFLPQTENNGNRRTTNVENLCSDDVSRQINAGRGGRYQPCTVNSYSVGGQQLDNRFSSSNGYSASVQQQNQTDQNYWKEPQQAENRLSNGYLSTSIPRNSLYSKEALMHLRSQKAVGVTHPFVWNPVPEETQFYSGNVEQTQKATGVPQTQDQFDRNFQGNPVNGRSETEFWKAENLKEGMHGGNLHRENWTTLENQTEAEALSAHVFKIPTDGSVKINNDVELLESEHESVGEEVVGNRNNIAIPAKYTQDGSVRFGPEIHQRPAVGSGTLHYQERLKEGDVLEPGEVILGAHGYAIPKGFRGRVTSLTGDVRRVKTTAHAQPFSENLIQGRFEKTGSDTVEEKTPTGSRKERKTSFEISSKCRQFSYSCEELSSPNGFVKICKPVLSVKDGVNCDNP